jgi:predicted TIM-barrel fold metal-dependent hydrolase
MPAFDAHTHAFPDDLAPQAISRLEDGCPWKAVGDGTSAGLLAAMDSAGVHRAFVCMIATKPSQEDNILAFCRRLQSARLLPLASVHPDSPHPAARLRQIADAGLAGIKVHPLYQDCPLDDARMDPIYQAAVDNGLLVTAHAGRDIAFPPDDDRASAPRILRVLARHPRLTFIATHLGGWQAWEDSEQLLADADAGNLHFELSFCLPCLPPARAAQLIRRLGPRRVLFGSDWPWADPAAQLAQLRALDLPASDLDLILHANADRVLAGTGLEPPNAPTGKDHN